MSEESEVKRIRGTGWKSVYETLRNEILSLALPPGQLLDEMTLAERFDMSRSPVREALIRLGADELVVTQPSVSAAVSALETAYEAPIGDAEAATPCSRRRGCGTTCSPGRRK